MGKKVTFHFKRCFFCGNRRKTMEQIHGCEPPFESYHWQELYFDCCDKCWAVMGFMWDYGGEHPDFGGICAAMHELASQQEETADQLGITHGVILEYGLPNGIA